MNLATIQQPYTTDEIRQQVTSGTYSAELMLQHALKNIEVLEANYAMLYNAALDGGACLMLESGRIPGFTKRGLEKMTNIIFSLPAPSNSVPPFQYDATYSAAMDVAQLMRESLPVDSTNDWMPEPSTYGLVLQINDMVQELRSCHTCKASNIKALLIDAVGKLLASMVGSCTCNTKTPDYTEHNDTCTYRLLHECYLIITAILDEVERVVSSRIINGDNNNEQQNP